MDSRINFREEGYHKGFADGRRTGGKTNKTFVDNNLFEIVQT